MVLGRPHLGCGRACPVSALTSAIFAQVHLVYPSLIGTFVLTVCAWRRIPVYCSHHVEMNMFAYKLVPIRPCRAYTGEPVNVPGGSPASDSRCGARLAWPLLMSILVPFNCIIYNLHLYIIIIYIYIH